MCGQHPSLACMLPGKEPKEGCLMKALVNFKAQGGKNHILSALVGVHNRESGGLQALASMPLLKKPIMDLIYELHIIFLWTSKLVASLKWRSNCCVESM